MSALKSVTATGDIVAVGLHSWLRSVTLTPAAAKSTVVVRTGGASGTTLLSLQAPADGVSAVWKSGDMGVNCPTGIHVTITGASATVAVEYD